ncbi:MAG: glycoside hydrolase family 97 protein [Marinifilaceae bacterium]
MKKTSSFAGIVLLLLILSQAAIGRSIAQKVQVNSPNGNISVDFDITTGSPRYSVSLGEKQLLSPSAMGFDFKNLPSLGEDLKIIRVEEFTENSSWETVWGESKTVSNHYNGLIIHLRETKAPRRKMDIEFRVFDDGLGFRYIIPEQKGLDSLNITSERTEFAIKGNPTTWWIPADFESYEHLYRTTSLSEVEGANTPVTMQRADGICLSIHEAALTNYAGMTLKRSSQSENTFESNLVPWPDGVKVKTRAGMKTPWRTIQIVSKPSDLITSHLILNLNEPNKLKDVSWIQPMKYVGVWWGMHIGTETWTMGPRHGATTQNTKRYIDFAAKHNIQAVLAEGWNTGWENWGAKDAFDQITPYADFNLKEVVQYGQKKGIAFIGHHETGGDIPSYEKFMEKAFQQYHELGIHAVKTGYAGGIIPRGQHHHGQWMVNHYRRVVETAAKYQLMVDAHEPIKPTGIRRTYPNMMTREGVRGMEWNAWSTGNIPEHTTILPFTRMLAGPIDYTPGIFDIKYERYKNSRVKWNSNDQGNSRVHTTLAKQLALFVVIYSPLQMAGDLPENYEGNPAFLFISDVKTDWDETRVINAAIGDYITIARRNGENWYLGSITDEHSRNLEASLDFLKPGTQYLATIYSDSGKTDLENNPTACAITKYIVSAKDTLHLQLTQSGGAAITLAPATKQEVRKIAPYPAE